MLFLLPFEKHGSGWRGRHDYNDAQKQSILKAAELESGDPNSWNNIGVIYQEDLEDYDNALKYLNIIIEKDPLYEKAWISIAKYYLRKNDHDKAIENLNKALNIISNNY